MIEGFCHDRYKYQAKCSTTDSHVDKVFHVEFHQVRTQNWIQHDKELTSKGKYPHIRVGHVHSTRGHRHTITRSRL